MPPRLLFRIALPLLLAGTALCGAPEAPFPGRPAVRVYTERDGLPQNTVWALAQDGVGRIWAGTLHGIGCYDGFGWTTAATPVPPASVWVNANAAGRFADGTLWFGTRSHGLLLQRDGAWTRIDRADGLGSENVNAALESARRGADGRPILWVGTFGGGLVRREGGRWIRTPIPGAPGADRIFALLEIPDRSGWPELWAGTQQGVWILGRDGWRAFPGNPRLPGRIVRALAWAPTDSAGTVWIGLEEGGIAAWDGASLTCQGARDGVPEGPVHALLPVRGPAGRWTVWATVGDHAPVVGRGGHWSEGGPGPIPALRAARALLALEPQGGPRVMYVGTEGQGVSRWSEGGWRGLVPPGGGDPRVLRILPGLSGKGEDLWFGMQSEGVWHDEDGRWQHWTVKDGLPHRTIRDLAWARVDGQTLLVAATNAGLARLQGGRWIPLPGGPGASSTPRSLLATRGPDGGRLWVCTRRGVSVWDGRRWTRLGPREGLESPSARCLAEVADPAGRPMVLAGTDGGLFAWSGERFQPVPLPGPLAGAGVSALLAVRLPDGQPAVALGTYGRGAGLLSIGRGGWDCRPLALGSETQPGGEVVLSLLQDRDGSLYAGTLKGVYRIRFRRDGSTTAMRCGEEDGLPARECTQGGGACDPAGRIWVGTAGGAACFDPAGELPDEMPKPLVLVGAWTGTPPGSLQPGAHLPPGPRRISFQYALVSHHREAESRYRTQLEGLESVPTDWEAEGRREFTNLPQGSYRLLVWGRDYAGNASGPLAFPFSVEPPVWATWWARLLGGLAGLGLLAAGYRWRSHRLRRRNEALEALVAERTREVQAQKESLERLTEDLVNLNIQKSEFLGMVAHDLRNPLNEIVLGAELVLDQEGGAGEGRAVLWRIRDAAARMDEMIGSILSRDALESGRLEIRAVPSDLGYLASESARAFEERAHRKGQRIRQEVPSGLVARVDPARFREVVDNLLSNALKFSPTGTAVTLVGDRSGGRIRIRVVDQGPGIPPADRDRLFQPHARLTPRPTGGEISTGLGLSIARGLMEAMGGSIHLECPPGGGCAFVLELPEAEAGA